MRRSHGAVRRLWAGGAVLVALSTVLTGCFSAQQPTEGGQSTASAQAAIASLPGVTDATVSSTPTVSGLGTEYPVTVKITLKTGYRVVDGAALADFLVRSAWSLNDVHRPTYGISIDVFVPEESDFDIGAYADDWDATTFSPSPRSGGGSITSFGITLPTSDSDRSKLEEKAGPWPCNPPTVPDGVIVPAS